MVQGPPPSAASSSTANADRHMSQKNDAADPMRASEIVVDIPPAEFQPSSNIAAGTYTWTPQNNTSSPSTTTYSTQSPHNWTNYSPSGSYSYSSPGNYRGVYTPSALSSTQGIPGTSLSQGQHEPAWSAPRPDISPPPFRKHWDGVIKSFLRSVGLTETLRGFEADMLILNPEWERKQLPSALAQLSKDLTELAAESVEKQESPEKDASLDERKLDCVRFAPGVEPRTPTTITKSISRFLAQNRARNDASNRNEFLLSLAEKRRKLDENGTFENASDTSIPSCARTDAKTQNRDLQMKYDIAKNEGGPLRKTMKTQADKLQTSDTKKPNDRSSAQDNGDVTAERYPALDERLRNIETHVAIRYVPSPPRSLLDRLKFLEDHLVQLEKEYPPWAALHFNQPNRGWPPPPRPTPIIVPSHLTSSTTPDRLSLLYNSSVLSDVQQQGKAAQNDTTSDGGDSGSSTPKQKSKQIARSTKSSLHRAVLERLEVQKAMNDLAGTSDSGSTAAQ